MYRLRCRQRLVGKRCSRAEHREVGVVRAVPAESLASVNVATCVQRLARS